MRMIWSIRHDCAVTAAGEGVPQSAAAAPRSIVATSSSSAPYAPTASAPAATAESSSRGSDGYSLVVKRGDPYSTHCPSDEREPHLAVLQPVVELEHAPHLGVAATVVTLSL